MYDKDWGLEATAKTQLEDILENAQDEMVKLMRERKRIEWRINETKKTILHLCGLLDVPRPDPLKDLGITDAIRSLIGLAKEPLTPTAIKAGLVAAEIGLPESNPLGPVHTILRRLEKGAEIQRVSIPSGIAYKWIGGLPPPPTLPSWMTDDRTDSKQTLFQELKSGKSKS